MTDKHHPGDWLWVIADGRMVATTFEAFDAARALGFGEAPDAWEELRVKGGSMGEFIKFALDALERSGKVRLELRESVTADGYRLPVYAVVPPEARAEALQQRCDKRARRKRRAATAPPPLVLVHGGATG